MQRVALSWQELDSYSDNFIDPKKGNSFAAYLVNTYNFMHKIMTIRIMMVALHVIRPVSRTAQIMAERARQTAN